MTADPVLYALPQTLRVEECHALDQFIRKHGDQPVHLNGQNVEKLGGLAAQLIVAHQSFRDEGSAIKVVNPSAALIDAMAILDLSDALEIAGEAA